jgi:uncharacterized membrane protein
MDERMNAKAPRGGGSTFLSSDRLASLTDTIFGVAMTLLATTLLPYAATLKGSALDMLRGMEGALTTVAFSFAISGTYWVVQQRRLAMTHSVTVRQTLLHFVFLFLIVLLPISTGLPGSAGSVQAVVMIFGGHLTLIALVNLLLWIDVHRSVVAHTEVLRSSAALALFVAGLAVGAVRPYFAQFFWYSVFVTPFISSNVTRRLYRH